MSAFENTYYFVDGSSLIADIKKIQKAYPDLRNKKLSIINFVKYYTSRFPYLTDGSYKRFTVYFVNKDERIKGLFILPNMTNPGESEDIYIKYCGKRIKGSKAAYKWLEARNPPKSVLEIINKSEKAVDTQICCDALSLSCYDRLDRLFLYTNDYDYFPLCEELKRNATNISLFRLFKENVNVDLVNNCDSFSVVDPNDLNSLFI